MDKEILHTYIDIFRDYVYKGDSGDTIILSPDTVNQKYCDEYYKEKIYDDASRFLITVDWTDTSLSDKTACDAVISAINKSGNLLFGGTRKAAIDFIEHHRANCAKSFRNLYGNCANDQQNFTDLCQHFGATYQLIAYLFFIKDKERYLPASPNNFDRLFPLIGIDDRKMSRHCTWDNYNWFIANVRAVQEEINEYLHLKKGISLLTAHSIVWILGILKSIPLEVERAEQTEETYRAPSSDKDINLNSQEFDGAPKTKPSYDTRKSSYFRRDRRIAQAALKKANHKCEFDNKHPTFTRKSNGEQYTEAHHLIPLAYQYMFDYSLDNIGNVVSLCSHCHNRLHYGKNLDQMIEQLFELKKDELQKAGLLKDITLDQLQIMYK